MKRVIGIFSLLPWVDDFCDCVRLTVEARMKLGVNIDHALAIAFAVVNESADSVVTEALADGLGDLLDGGPGRILANGTIRQGDGYLGAHGFLGAWGYPARKW